ncbi:MAG: DUF480 domain-containing protein [Pirellulales bacterium]|nr:DUF480 domain-containing protein [Pirellulales bacterium]
MTDDSNLPENQATPRWKPLSSIDRRVLGVLIEKAKTTPDAYPLSLNAITTGANQKSNRDPMMNLEPDDVEESLDRLRNFGAVGIVQGIGRVSKYRHYAYEWFGVDKVELAVLAELLLRGAQPQGELRARAARMEPIPGLPELRPVVASLKSKKLVVPLTPEGRGHVVTHGLYMPQEMQKLRDRYQGDSSPGDPSSPTKPPTPVADMVPPCSSPPPTPTVEPGNAFKAELAELRDQMTDLRAQLQELAAAQQRSENELHDLRSALGE